MALKPTWMANRGMSQYGNTKFFIYLMKKCLLLANFILHDFLGTQKSDVAVNKIDKY